MNPFKCLLDSGMITEEQYEAILKTSVTGEAELLRVIASMMISQNDLLSSPTVLSIEEITVDNMTPASLTVPDTATGAVITVYDSAIVYRINGVNPTLPNGGHYAEILTTFEVSNPSGFRVLSASATDAILFITYFK